jgi:hypothetical protein
MLLPGLTQTQVTITAPGAPRGGPPSEARYGPPRVAELDAIAVGDGYQKAHVITEGVVGLYLSGQYWTLGQLGTSVLLIPGRDLDASLLNQAGDGRKVEVRGIVRQIRPKEYIKGIDIDLLEDPLLPPMPPPSQGGPRMSITAFAIRDRSNQETFKPVDAGGGISRQILDQPSAYAGKTTKILGQFRGRNLFGDLPPQSARGKDDWVLKDGDTAIWVTGKSPKGEGWKLDLDYKGDSKSWLEVEGKPEILNGVVYLKASRVLISKAPGTEKGGPAPR